MTAEDRRIVRFFRISELAMRGPIDGVDGVDEMRLPSDVAREFTGAHVQAGQDHLIGGRMRIEDDALMARPGPQCLELGVGTVDLQIQRQHRRLSESFAPWYFVGRCGAR